MADISIQPRSTPAASAMTLSPMAWGIALAVVILLGEAVGFLAASQGGETVAAVVRLISRTLALGWLGYGLWRWRELPMVRRFAGYFLITLGATAMWVIASAAGWSQLTWAIVAMYTLAAGFAIGLAVLRFILSPGIAALGIARTLIDEAIRMKVAVVFIVALLLFVPILPIIMDAEDFLQYRIQGFLTWSLTLTGFLLGTMTIFLSVMTVSSEVRSKRIFLTMTKPVGAGTYLFGKWLGMALLNALLVAIFGGGIYFFTMNLADQATSMSANNPQRIAVEERVMLARQAINPILPTQVTWQQVVEDRIAQLRTDNPGMYGTIDAKTRANILQDLHRDWYRLGPRMSRGYRFTGLLPAKETDQTVQLRMTPRIGGETQDGKIQLAMRANGRMVEDVQRMSDRTTHVINISTALIDDQGMLILEVANPSIPVGNPPRGFVDQPTISFDTDDGIQMLYRVGGFTPNLVRSLIILWLATLFLAMVGLTTGTYLNFPAASVFCMMVFIAAVGSGFIAESFEFYAGNPPRDATMWQTMMWYPTTVYEKWSAGEVWEGIKIIIRLIGRGFMLMVPDFAIYNPVPMINDGLLVSWRLVGEAALYVGVIATGIVGIIGYVIFRGKEMAQVTV